MLCWSFGPTKGHVEDGAAATTGRTEEQVVCVGAKASYPEYLNHVEELAVDVADDGDGGINVDDIALFHQELFSFCANGLDDRVCKQLLPVEPRYALVEVNRGCEWRGNQLLCRWWRLRKLCYVPGRPGIAVECDSEP